MALDRFWGEARGSPKRCRFLALMFFEKHKTQTNLLKTKSENDVENGGAGRNSLALLFTCRFSSKRKEAQLKRTRHRTSNIDAVSETSCIMFPTSSLLHMLFPSRRSASAFELQWREDGLYCCFYIASLLLLLVLLLLPLPLLRR